MKDRVLVVDDDQDTCDLLEASLVKHGFDVESRTSSVAALDVVSRERIDIVLTDLGMAGMDGIDLIGRVLEATPDILVIVVTGQGTMESAVSAIRAGAYDFLTKPIDPKMLALAVARASQRRRLTRELQKLREGAVSKTDGMIVGESEPMRRALEMVQRVKASDASVLIHGETGTGKELIARAIHASSPRAKGPFVAINCAAIPPTLLESELFGHTKGAFTDARADRNGLFIQATGGTLFLDEIAETPLEMQAKLLRALQERTVRPVGGDVEMKFDARVIAASNQNLEAEVQKKKFREDLFYRLNVVTIELPPLRQRGTDILRLASHFLAKHSSRTENGALALSPRVAQKLMAYDWPGNVRELENSMERAVALARFSAITVEDLPQKVRAYGADTFVVAADEAGDVVTIDELERRYIDRVLKLLDGNKSRAAQALGLDRRTLHRKLERYEQRSPRDGIQ